MAIRDQAVFGAYVGGSPNDIESKLGVKLAVINQFFNWGDDIGSFLSGVGDRIPLATLEPWNYSLAQISGGSADSYLSGVASDCKSFGKPVYLRPLHEFNGDWYPWSPNVGQEAAFKSAWSHMAGILKGASNVRLIWCPNADTVNRADPAKCWPGSNVDVIGIDGYNWNGTPFESVMSSMYSKVTGLGSQEVWVCETACGESGEKPGWVDGMFKSTKFPRMKAVVWFHTNKEKDWRIDSSSASLNAFKSNLSGVSPPPPGPGPDQPPQPPQPPSGTNLTIAKPTTDNTTYAAGAKVSAKTKLTASGGDVAVQRATLTMRAPGSTHAGGPYYDFSPDIKGTTVKSGTPTELSGTFTLPADAKSGTWEIYATYQDSAGAWHDGPSASVAVGGSAPPQPGIQKGDSVKVTNRNSRFYNKTGKVSSVNTSRKTAMVLIGRETSSRMFPLDSLTEV